MEQALFLKKPPLQNLPLSPLNSIRPECLLESGSHHPAGDLPNTVHFENSPGGSQEAPGFSFYPEVKDFGLTLSMSSGDSGDGEKGMGCIGSHAAQ